MRVEIHFNSHDTAMNQTGSFMQITRHHHLRYMAKITPMLIVLYIIQVLLYQKFAPSHLAGEVNLVMGIGLAFIILCYQFYDHHHKIHFKENYVEVRFDLLKMREEILYSNITQIEIRKKDQSFAEVVLYQRDGAQCHLHHVDSPELITEFIEKKRNRNISS